MVVASTTLAGFGAVALSMVPTPGPNMAYLVSRPAFLRPLMYIFDGGGLRCGV